MKDEAEYQNFRQRLKAKEFFFLFNLDILNFRHRHYSYSAQKIT